MKELEPLKGFCSNIIDPELEPLKRVQGEEEE